MSGLESTCGECPNLRFGDIGGLKTAFCGGDDDDDFIVPHQSHLENGIRGDNTIMVLTRIPNDCERNDANKSDEPAPQSEWVRLTVTPQQYKV